MSTFDELYDEFFGKRKKSKKNKIQKEMFGDELKKLIETLSKAKQITDESEQYEIDNEFGEPNKIEYFNEDDLFFKRSIWVVNDGEIVKLEVSDQPFKEEYVKSLEETLQEALDVENYELAAEIRDKMNQKEKNTKKVSKKLDK